MITKKEQPFDLDAKRAAGEQAEEAAAMDVESKQRIAKLKAETEDARTQAEKFAQAAREHGASDDEEALKGVLRKLGKAKQ